MTDQSSTRLDVRCTECDFSATAVRTDDGWTTDSIERHLETGHTLRTLAVDSESQSE